MSDHTTESASTVHPTELVFFGVLTAVMVFLLSISFQYDERARLVPILVLVVLVGLLGAKMVILVGEAVGVDVTARILPEKAEPDEIYAQFDRSEEAPVGRQVRMVGWTVLFAGSMYVLGLSVAIPLSLLAFLLVESHLSVLQSVVFTAAVSGAIYGLFVVILHVPQYEGILF